MDLAPLIVPGVAFGLVIGIFSGMLGIGGGTMMVPLFRLAFGMSAVASTATSLFTIIPTSIAGSVTHMREKTCIPALGVACGLGGACTSPFGVWLAQLSPGWAVMIAAAAVIIYSAAVMLHKALKMPCKVDARKAVGADSASSDQLAVGSRSAASSAAGLSKPVEEPESVEGVYRPTRKQIGLGVVIGFVAGVASGYIGVGGGFIMVPMLLTLTGITMRYASGTSLIGVMILAIPGTIENGLMGNTDFLVGVLVAIGSIPGAVIGAKLARFIPERILRILFAVFLIIAGALLVVREVGLLG